MKMSGGVSFTLLYEVGGEVKSDVIAFTISIDPETNTIVIVDNLGNNYVPEGDH